MKKFVIILLVICLAAAGILGYLAMSDKAPEEAEEGENELSFRLLDTDKLYALHEPQEVVASINGVDILWENYFYNVFSQAMQAQEYFKGMASYYGVAVDWDSPADESGKISFADSVLQGAEAALLQFEAIRGFAGENNISLSEEQLKSMEEQTQKDIKLLCGEEAGEEEFQKYLENIYMSRALYDDINLINHLYRDSYIQLYGEKGEKLSDDKALSFLSDGKYMYANHILLSTVDMSTGEPLDEESVREKEARAQEISQELRAIKEPQELLKRYAELKTELCEDSGKEIFPDGMLFRPGDMVKEFEDGAAALEEYQVSEPVKSQFGYHIILRLPLDPDAILEYTQKGTPVSARGAAANTEYNTRLQDYLAGLSIEYAPGFEKPVIMDYLR